MAVRGDRGHGGRLVAFPLSGRHAAGHGPCSTAGGRRGGGGGCGTRADAEAWTIGLAERVLSLLSGNVPETPALSPRDSRRIGAVLRHIELHADEALDLDALAGIARMSKYHFLRTFRRVAGVTPHGYLVGLRLRRAALRIRTTREHVSAIAFDAGFGDLSTFNARFRETFGASPTAFRVRA